VASSAKTYGINAVSSVGTRILQISVLVWVNQYLLKRIPAEEYSLLPLLMSLLVFGELFKNAFVSGVGRFIVEADTKGEEESVTRVVSSVFPYLAGLAAILALVGGVALYFVTAITGVDPEYENQARGMLALLLLPLLGSIVGSPFQVGLYVKQRFVVLNAIDLGCEILRVAMVVGLLLGVSVSVLWLVVASTTASLLNLALRIFFTRRELPSARFRREYFSKATAKQLFSFSAWTSIGSLMSMVVTTVPVLLLGHFSSALEIACYHLGRLPDVNIRRLALAAMIPAQPALTALYARNGMDAVKALYFRGGKYHLWATLVLVAPLVVFGGSIVQLYVGEDYLRTAQVFTTLLMMYPFIWASAMFYRVAHANGNVGAFFRCEIITVIVSVPVLYLLIAVFKMGALGAALGVAVPSVLNHVLQIWQKGLKTVAGSWRQFYRETLVPGLLPFGGAIVVSVIFRNLVSLDNWLVIGLGSGVAMLVYLWVMVQFCFDVDDRAILKKAGGLFAKLQKRAGLKRPSKA